MVWVEGNICRVRINDALATESVLLHAAIADILVGKKTLEKAIESMRDGE